MYRNHYYDESSVFGSALKFQLQVGSGENPRMLRDLQSSLMGQMVVLPGIITAASKTMIKSTKVVIKCSNCGHEKSLTMKSGFAGTLLPRQCDQMKNPGLDRTSCPVDPYRILPDKSDFMDQ